VTETRRRATATSARHRPPRAPSRLPQRAPSSRVSSCRRRVEQYRQLLRDGLGEINGVDFVDSNGDLIPESGEPLLSGTKIVLSGTDDFGNVLSSTTTTNASGAYSFTGSEPEQQQRVYRHRDGPQRLRPRGTNVDHDGRRDDPAATPIVSKIVLTSNGASSTDNFAEYPPT